MDCWKYNWPPCWMLLYWRTCVWWWEKRISMQHNWVWLWKCLLQRLPGTVWIFFRFHVRTSPFGREFEILWKPISAHRFWGLQIILTSLPLVVYSIISQHMNEKLAKCWLMKRFKKKRERKKRKNRRILRWIYGCCSIARLAIGESTLHRI